MESFNKFPKQERAGEIAVLKRNAETLRASLDARESLDLSPEDQRELAEATSSLGEKLAKAKELLAAVAIAAGGTALAAGGIGGLEELRQMAEVPKESVAILLGAVIALTTVVQYMRGKIG